MTITTTLAVARSTDPQTSWDAAESVQRITETQTAIMILLRATPMCDEKLIQQYRAFERVDGFPPATDQSIRSRRAELVRLGLVEPADWRELMTTGRFGQAWQVVR